MILEQVDWKEMLSRTLKIHAGVMHCRYGVPSPALPDCAAGQLPRGMVAAADEGVSGAASLESPHLSITPSTSPSSHSILSNSDVLESSGLIRSRTASARVLSDALLEHDCRSKCSGDSASDIKLLSKKLWFPMHCCQERGKYTATAVRAWVGDEC